MAVETPSPVVLRFGAFEYFYTLNESPSKILARLFPPESWSFDTGRYSIRRLFTVRSRRSCFGMAVYLQNRLPLWEWRKKNVRPDLVRWWDSFDYGATWWHPFSPVFHLPLPDRTPAQYAFFSLRPWHERYNPFPKAARRTLSWKMGHKHKAKDCAICPENATMRKWFSLWFGSRHRNIYIPLPATVAAWLGIRELDWLNGEDAKPPKLTKRLKRGLFMGQGIMPSEQVAIDPYSSRKQQEDYSEKMDAPRSRLVGWIEWLEGSKDTRRLDRFLKPWKTVLYRNQRLAITWDYTFVRRDWKPKEIPHYKTHDSAAAIMAYVGCSRATAFRKIKAGFRIPTAQSTA